MGTKNVVFAIALLTALHGQAAGQSGARTGLTKDGYQFNDSHFHLTNYIQEGITTRDLLRLMGTTIGRSTLFGIPLQQQWSHRLTGDFAPTYYLDTDAPLYYYSFTDAYIAAEYRSLSRAEQARFDPMITGFNPTDMYAADHIRRVLQTFPGVFSGIGEFTIHKEFVSSKVAGDVASLSDPALDRILEFAGEVGLVAIVHNDIATPFFKPAALAGNPSPASALANAAPAPPADDVLPINLVQMKSLLRRHPNTTIIWAHAGLGRIIQPLPEHTKLLEEILRDPGYRHVHFDLSWSEVAKYVVTDAASARNTAELINRYPDRFLFGTDNVAPADTAKHFSVYHQYDPLWALLTPDTRELVLEGNYERLFDAARRRVREWERAHPK